MVVILGKSIASVNCIKTMQNFYAFFFHKKYPIYIIFFKENTVFQHITRHLSNVSLFSYREKTGFKWYTDFFSGDFNASCLKACKLSTGLVSLSTTRRPGHANRSSPDSEGRSWTGSREAKCRWSFGKVWLLKGTMTGRNVIFSWIVIGLDLVFLDTPENAA